MIYWLVVRLCIGQTIEKILYLQENEYYQQGLYQLFSDTTDHQYSFVDQSKGFYLVDSNLKQEQAGKYATNPSKIANQKQFRNLEDHQGNKQYGILIEDGENKYRLCYNSDMENLDIDICIKLDSEQYGYDFTFIDYNTVAISSIQNSFFQVAIYQKVNLISQFSFQPSIYYQSVKSTKIDMMVNDGDKYLLVVGIYPTDQINILIDVLIFDLDYTITQSPYSINFKDINDQEVYGVLDIKGSNNGTVFVQGIGTQIQILQIQLQKDRWILQEQFQQLNNIGFDLGFSVVDGKSFRSLILISDQEYSLQSIDNSIQIQNNFQKLMNKESSFRFTKNYLIIIQDNQLIISNFNNNIQKINYFSEQILSIDVDFQNDKLILFTINEIIKYQLQDSYLSFQGQKTNNIDDITITNGLKQVQIRFRVLESSDNNLYQLTNGTDNIYYNLMYSPGPFKIPVPVSGFDPTLQLQTDKQLKIVVEKYQVIDATLDKNLPLFSQILVTNGRTSVFKQYDDFIYIIYYCDQEIQKKFDCYNQQTYESKYYEQVKLYTQQQGDYQGYLILLNNQIDIYGDNYEQNKIKDVENITEIIITDRIFVVYETFIKVYTYPNAVEICKLDSFQLKIDNPLKIWANNLFNNYLFILSKTGQLVIGQFTNRFYLTQIIQYDSLNIDISIVSYDKIILSQQINNGQIDVSLYNIINGQIVKQYSLDLHNYSLKNYVLLKDYLNGKVGVYAQKDDQKVLLLYGLTQFKRDQLQKIIYLDKDQEFNQISLCGNRDQTHLILTQKNQSNYKLIFAYYEAQYIYISAQPQYLTNQFSQALPITYLYSNNQGNNITLQNQIFYEYDFYTVKCEKQIIEVHYDKQNQLEYELPKNLFQGQINFIETTYNPLIKLETRVQNPQEVKQFGYNPKCKQVVKFSRILCLGEDQIRFHNYQGDLIQEIQTALKPSYETYLNISIDNSKAIIVQKTELYLVNISQNSIYLYQGAFPISTNFQNTIFYKNWIVNQENNQLQFYYIYVDQQWRLEKQILLNISGIIKFDYHPVSESIYFTQQTSNLLSSIKCSLETDSINIGQVQAFDIQEYLFNKQIYTKDLLLNYLKVSDNSILISSNYGHIYTFNLENLELINIYLGSSHIQDIYIDDRYLIMNDKLQLFLYENTQDWNINKPYLSLEPITNHFFHECIALFKDDQNVTNILITPSNTFLQKFIINDKYKLTFNNLSEQAPTSYSIYGGNPYNYSFTTINPLKQNHNSSNVWIIIVSILGVIMLIAIIGYIYKKKRQRTHDLFIN